MSQKRKYKYSYYFVVLIDDFVKVYIHYEYTNLLV